MPEDTGEGEVIVITGSRIGDPLGKQAPVRMLGREDLERTGLGSIGDILQQLPVSGGAINNKNNSSGNFGAPPDGGGIGAGATEADLRYLGSKRVLVLVDGVRWINGSSASGLAASTDLNTIPLGIIERIEVLEDGASPIYGSDAIAGVINIITRKEFSGVMASAYSGGLHEGDGFVQKYDMTWGSTSPKTNIVFSASYFDQRLVSSADREISRFPSPGIGRCTDNCSSALPQGRVRFDDPRTPQNDTVFLVLPEGTATPSLDAYVPFTDEMRFNFAPFNLVQTPSQRINAFTHVSHKLLPNVSLRGKASFTNRQSVNQAAPEPLFIGPGGASGTRMDTLRIDVTNPYNPFGISFDPADNPNYVVSRRPLEAGPRKFEQNVNTFYVAGGVDGHVNLGSQRLNWDATLAYGLNRAEQRRNNSFNSSKLQLALGPAYVDETGRFRCGTAMSPGPSDCVPINVFGGQGADGRGTITREMLAYATFTEHDVSQQELVDLTGNISSNLVKLPGGWLSAAIGAEHRRMSGFFEPDAVVAAGDSADIPATPTQGEYSISEAYAELRVPIASGKPGLELLDLNAAARLSSYSFLDPEVTGKLGARYKPTKDLIVRASVGTGFRAPSLGELFGRRSRFDATLTDPCSSFNGDENEPEQSEAVKQRCIMLGAPADGSYEAENAQISVVTDGNRALEPETSTSFNISAAYSPAALQDTNWVSRLELELAFYDIRLDSAISAYDAQYQLDSCVLRNDDSLCRGITRNVGGLISSFENQIQNINGFETRGLDLTVSYVMPRKSFGRFRGTLQSSYLLDFWEKVPSGSGTEKLEREGTVAGEPERAYPRFKSNLALGWLYQGLELTLTTRYIHSITEQCRGFSTYPGTCSDFEDDDNLSTNKLGITVYNDVQAVWSPQFDPGLTITLGVNNVTNREPPDCYTCSLNGFASTTYDIPGVFGYLSASYRVQ